MKRFVKNSNGFSLIELLISIVIFMFSFLAMGNVMMTCITVNMANDMRGISVEVASQAAEALQSLAMNDTELTSGSHTRTSGDMTQDGKGMPQPNQEIRGAQKTYTITWDVTDVNTNLKQVEISVQYTSPQGQSITNREVMYKHR